LIVLTHRLTPLNSNSNLLIEHFGQKNKWLQRILAGGNVVPLDRSGSLEQPLFQMFQKKIAEGSWCHIFPEGKVKILKSMT
jgi:Acyltransferase